MMWRRKEQLQDLQPHHFVNKGGVVFEKEFLGFEKYH
jgi:hypothetical protein